MFTVSSVSFKPQIVFKYDLILFYVDIKYQKIICDLWNLSRKIQFILGSNPSWMNNLIRGIAYEHQVELYLTSIYYAAITKRQFVFA